jgi:hypothetical protein
MISTDTKAPLGWIKFWTPKDDWYALDAKAREKYLDGLKTVEDRALSLGGRLIGTYKCRGQSSWARFEMWELPNLQALIEITNELEQIGHYQYFSESNTFGRQYMREGDPDSWVI